MSKIDPEVFQKIRSLCEHAGKLAQMGENDFAISKYYEAMILVPDPKSDHSISTFIYTAIGEEYFKLKDYSEAGKCFMKSLKCPGGNSIAQISLRIGQCLEECGERKRAQDYLCQAYLLGGDEVFAKVSPKYYKIIRSEIEGTNEIDDEIDLLHEDDEYDIIDSILQSGDSRSSGDYTGYSGINSDKDVDLYKRPRTADSLRHQRTTDDEPTDTYGSSEFLDDGEKDDSFSNYFDADSSGDDYDYDDYDADEEDDYDEDDNDEDDGDDFEEYDDEDDDDNVSFWVKVKSAIKKFTDLFQ